MTKPIFCFQPCQIVCLEHDRERLYAEVVQLIENRQICWVRPLGLAIALSDPSLLTSSAFGQVQWYDLRNGADLLLPAALFRSAFDTEVIPLVTGFYCSSTVLTKLESGTHQRLSQFVQQVCQARPDVFQAPAEQPN